MSSSKLYIPLPKCFSWKACHFFLDRGYDEVLYHLEPSSITRAIVVEGRSLVLRIEAGAGKLIVSGVGAKIHKTNAPFIRDYISQWFDLNRDLEPFYELLRDHGLGSFRERYQGLRLVGINDLHEAICWCVIGQQINLTFAYRLKRRLVETYGEKVKVSDRDFYLFPTAARLADAKAEDLRAMQFSKQKISYLIGISKAIRDGEISKSSLSELPSFEDRLKALQQLKGVGAWTANYVLMKVLRDPNCIPHGDTGLIQSLVNLNVIQHKSETEKIATFFDPFTGWKSYLSFYLWRSLGADK